MEKEFAEFEGKVAPALSRIIKEGSIKNEEDRDWILNLIVLLAIRNPRIRENVGDFQEKILKDMAKMMVATPERWASQMEQMKADGHLSGDPDIGYEGMKEFVEKGDFKFEIKRSSHIKMELEMFDKVFPFFAARKWTLLKAADNSGGFVTSDHPVSLRWSRQADNKGFFPPGYGMEMTDVMFPLSSNLALIGRFEGEEKEATADFFSVASYNANVIGLARRQIYARDDAYSYLRTFPQPLGSGSTLLKDPNLKNLDIEED